MGGNVRQGKPLGLVSILHQHTIDKSLSIFLMPVPSGPSLRDDTALTALVPGRMRPAELAGK